MGVVMSELKDSISIFSKIREIIIPGFSSWVSEKQTVSNKTGKINESIDSAIEYNFYFPANEVHHKNINLQIIDYYENILIVYLLLFFLYTLDELLIPLAKNNLQGDHFLVEIQ